MKATSRPIRVLVHLLLAAVLLWGAASTAYARKTAESSVEAAGDLEPEEAREVENGQTLERNREGGRLENLENLEDSESSEDSDLSEDAKASKGLAGFASRFKAVASGEASTKTRRSSAWTLSYPLGLHEPCGMDTLLYNYQRTAIPSMVSDAYAATGNLGASGQNQIFFERPTLGTFFFENAVLPWIPDFGKQKFYNVYIPMTLVSYGLGGPRGAGQDRLKATFAGNVNRKIGIGAHADYIYSKGSYNNQADKDFAFGLSGYYRGDRYEVQAFYNQYSLLQKESGGITNDLYITDPAQLQGGVDKIDSKSIPTNLTDAHSRILGSELYMNHAYNVGFWRDEQVNDTLTREVYVPVTKFLYTLDYRYGHHLFLANSNQNFWKDHYYSLAKTYDDTYFWQLDNTVGISMIEGFQKWAKFGLAAYASYQLRHFKQASLWYAENLDIPVDDDGTPSGLTPMPPGASELPPSLLQHHLFVGGEITKQRGSILRYAARVRFGLMGETAGDVEAEGTVTARFRMLRDTVSITARGLFHNTSHPYLIKNYVSNNFCWVNDFGQTRRFRVGGELQIPWTHTTLSAGFENLQNYVYFGPDCMPRQHGGNIQVFTARLEQKLRFGVWNWDNTVIYQKSSNQAVLPLPALALYSNMYIHTKLFRVLDLQAGVDCDYYTRYAGVAYQPATMTFHVQSQEPEQKVLVGNFPFMNLYLTCRLYRTRFFLAWTHFNQGWFTKSIFALPHYPVNPRRLQVGISVDFAN